MSFANKSYKGIFKPKNPSKYKGDANNIVYRSSWEVRVMKWLDDNPNVIWWASEELPIPYKSPIDQKIHRYFPDFIVRLKQRGGKETTLILEIKPESQTKKPIYEGKNMTAKKLDSYIHSTKVWITNQAKFKAAQRWADARGYRFGVVDENFLFKSK